MKYFIQHLNTMDSTLYQTDSNLHVKQLGTQLEDYAERSPTAAILDMQYVGPWYSSDSNTCVHVELDSFFKDLATYPEV